jgi:hypothetical protein
VTDLLGQMPVRLAAENGELVAYGFGQRVAIPAADVGRVVVHGAPGGFRRPGLLVLDKQARIMVAARGMWSRDVTTVLSALGRQAPEYLNGPAAARWLRQWTHAPGYQKLRVRPKRYALRVVSLIVLWLLLSVLGLLIGVGLAGLLPAAAGAVRVLFGLVLVVALVCGAGYLTGLAVRAARWVAISREVGSLAPPGQFLRAGEETIRRRRKFVTIAMVVAIPVLIGWGPGVGIASLAHGFADQRLVTQLRTGGVATTGYVIDVPQYSTDSDGNTVVTEQVTLEYFAGRTLAQSPDPAIGGWTWPVDPDQPVTIVYDRADPSTAAVQGQIAGSPWHGAPIANVVSGAALTVLLLVQVWLTFRRIRGLRRATREEFVADLV